MKRRTRRWLLGLVIVVLLLAAIVFGTFKTQAAGSYTPMVATGLPVEFLSKPIAASGPEGDQLRKGQYLVRVGDCASCHTKDGGALLAGGFALNTPFGVIYSSNLTSDPDAGIGKWTLEQFYASLHAGKSGSGGHLYPAMPYPYTTKVTAEDSAAMLAFLKTVPASKAAKPANELPFPFNIRTLVSGWNLLFFREQSFQPDAAQSADWNRGNYLVNGLGHCAACHSPKNSLAGDKADQAFYGGTLDEWTAPDLTSNSRTGLGTWSPDDIVEYLRTGRNAHANAGGSMAEVVTYSTSTLNDQDLHAIAIYLKSLPAQPETSSGTSDQKVMKLGAAIYSDACSSCHLADGSGQPGMFPSLRGNAVSQQPDATGFLHIVLAGDRTATTEKRPSPLAMPSFGWKLSDQEIADVTTYVRNSWGNKAPPVNVLEVGLVRKKLKLATDQVQPSD